MLRAGNMPQAILIPSLEFLEIDIKYLAYIISPIILPRKEFVGIPEWVQNAINQDRLDLIIEELESGKEIGYCGISELSLYLSELSLLAPLSSEWADLYLWAGRELIKKHNPGILKLMSDMPIVEFESVERNFNKLSKDIRRLANKIGMQYVKSRGNKSTQKPKISLDKSVIEAVQLELFKL